MLWESLVASPTIRTVFGLIHTISSSEEWENEEEEEEEEEEDIFVLIY